MKKIDIHCHTTNRKVPDILPESADLAKIKKEMEKHDIEQTVVLATYFPHRGTGISNFRLHHWIKDKPEFAMFGSLDFQNYFQQGMNELSELAESSLIKGIKLYTCYQEIDLDSTNMKELVGLAKKHNLPLMFHSGYSYSSMRKYNRKSIAAMVKPGDLEDIAWENPNPVIISHMGKPFTDDLIEVVGKYSNLMTDVSGLIDSKFDRDEIPRVVEDIKRFLGECGSHKLLFGTDFPVQTHQDSVCFIETAMKHYSEHDKEDVYYNNARRILN